MVKNPPARQETWIRSLVQEDATCLQAPKPVHHSCRTRGPRPMLCNKRNMEVKSLSRVRLFPTLWTVAYHVPSSMGFSRPEHWVGSGIGWVATQPNRVGCHCLLQRIFLTQRSNPGLPHCRQPLYRLSPQREARAPQRSPCLAHQRRPNAAVNK